MLHVLSFCPAENPAIQRTHSPSGKRPWYTGWGCTLRAGVQGKEVWESIGRRGRSNALREEDEEEGGRAAAVEGQTGPCEGVEPQGRVIVIQVNCRASG